MQKGLRWVVSICSALVLLSGCTKGGDDEDGGSNNGGNKNSRTDCGVVFGGQLVNPVNQGDGTFVRVTDILSNNLVLVTEDANPSKRYVIKLQGVRSATSAPQNQQAISHIRSLTGGGAYFFKATDDCLTSLDGQSAMVGSLVTPNGLSVGEDLIRNAASSADSNDVCRGHLLGSCYQTLSDQNNEEELPPFADAACGFLWKPESDKDGRAVVLVDACDVRVFVNGEEFEQAGAGNGRCTTARGSRPGCAYGNATIEVYDLITGAPYEFGGGKTKVNVSGCQRFELPCTE